MHAKKDKTSYQVLSTQFFDRLFQNVLLHALVFFGVKIPKGSAINMTAPIIVEERRGICDRLFGLIGKSCKVEQHSQNSFVLVSIGLVSR